MNAATSAGHRQSERERERARERERGRERERVRESETIWRRSRKREDVSAVAGWQLVAVGGVVLLGDPGQRPPG